EANGASCRNYTCPYALAIQTWASGTVGWAAYLACNGAAYAAMGAIGGVCGATCAAACAPPHGWALCYACWVGLGGVCAATIAVINCARQSCITTCICTGTVYMGNVACCSCP